MGWTQWPKDILRHTAGTMMLAHYQNADRVRRELGNSESVLFRHYVELVTKEEAALFWALTAASPSAPQSPSPSPG